ncbi:30S ribosomal protein S15 [Candidatus Micrarchaeota archaeon]|nr:30S ribosomal protein S15 [Candidatus Micrarchaeota archaeon]MBU1165513.1 30S ribosomal protein S15 [Candidatus Micrarchaeota archaeon]MBU1887411.1 30S ribosomal protein S15 [Candidatus Micrarchaeota archaeon]
MARLHSKKKGKSGTKRPKSKTAPKWVDKKKAEVTEVILKMAREGVQSAKIGAILRDQYGVPNLRAVLGASLVVFLKSEGINYEYPDDLLDLIKKAVRINGHLKNIKNDTHNEVKLGHVESKIHRLTKYYASKGKIPTGWRYNREKATLLVK